MPHAAASLAQRLVTSNEDTLEELRVHLFDNDGQAHDDAFTRSLRAEFIADFDRVQQLLSEEYGEPVRIGLEDDEIIPLNGVFRFAIWEVGEKGLYAAAAHEDRGVPMLLMLGTRNLTL